MAAKKSFKAQMSNPAMMFFSTDNGNQAEEKAAPLPMSEPEPARRRIYARREMKSRRWQILVRPSLYEAVCDEADRRGITPNSAINDILAEYFAHK